MARRKTQRHGAKASKRRGALTHKQAASIFGPGGIHYKKGGWPRRKGR